MRIAKIHHISRVGSKRHDESISIALASRQVGGDCAVMSHDPIAVALDFVARINAHEPDRVAELMTLDHEFIDMAGSTSRGRETMRKAWLDYFQMFPDYHVHIDDTLAKSHKVIFIGHSDGTLSNEGRTMMTKQYGAVPLEDDLQGPAIWTAIVCDGKVAQWRVYDDTAKTRHLLGLATDVSQPLHVQAVRR